MGDRNIRVPGLGETMAETRGIYAYLSDGENATAAAEAQLARWFPPRLQYCSCNGVDEGEEHRLLVPQHVDCTGGRLSSTKGRTKAAECRRASSLCRASYPGGHKVEKSEAGSLHVTEAMVEPEPRPKRWQRSYLLQAFSAALAGIRKRYRQLAQFKKKREIDDG